MESLSLNENVRSKGFPETRSNLVKSSIIYELICVNFI
jgi:hypothetical protein